MLAVTDTVVDGIHSPNITDRFGDVDLVVACGDLPYMYLEYIATMLNVPCFFVHGNHDRVTHLSNGLTLTSPRGWVNLDMRTVRSKGVILGGLEGSIRYRPHASFQYTNVEMALRIWAMTPRLLMNRAFHGRYLDILVAHSPAFGIQDGQDRPHRGFKPFLGFMARFRPRYLLHGHQHIYGPARKAQRTRYMDTEVINVYPYRVVEL
jgi:Icc-related predicted phosphoesterase